MKKLLLAFATLTMFACTGQNTPLQPSQIVEGELSGEFSVSPIRKVHFSKGNLQYQASTHIWRFAEHQYDVIGSGNANISTRYSGYIDLFGWGTGNNPTLISDEYSDYSRFYDWGENAISNGGNKSGLWRTLSISEWTYLCSGRARASNLLGTGTVNGILGVIFLPDDESIPDGLSFKYQNNKYTIAQWKQLEQAGAVFLPAAGTRDNNYFDQIRVFSVNEEGFYWSDTHKSSVSSYGLWFYEGRIVTIDDGGGLVRRDGNSVRLVRDIK